MRLLMNYFYRFVRRSFQLALQKVNPEVVVFLGDLLNDGSISDDGEFIAQAKYFKSIMTIPPSVKV